MRNFSIEDTRLPQQLVHQGISSRLQSPLDSRDTIKRTPRTREGGGLAWPGDIMIEEQFVNIDLNDDNVCSICKLGTERETLSFCHICFELSIEGIPKEQLNMMPLREVEQLNGKLLKQVHDVFEELTKQVQEKDSLASQLNVRHISIEQLLKNCSKLPCLQMGRAAMKSNVSI
ncbi:Protein EURL like protein [Crotalus adamanteus]|uniref:Protein EURL like protein n=1 Tax=Crotalus adamanteus TaxID=8729 RepID=A0AAW1BJP2_CROAD